MKEMAGISLGSNKQSKQSNEDDETRLDHLNNLSYCEINNNSAINSLGNNENQKIEKKKKKEKIRINIKEENRIMKI